VRGWLGVVDFVERFWIMEAGARIVDVADDGLVENIALGWLDPHRANENKLGDVGGRHRRHFGRDPAAEAEPDQYRLLNFELRKQTAVHHGQVSNAAHPLRTLRTPPSRV